MFQSHNLKHPTTTPTVEYEKKNNIQIEFKLNIVFNYFPAYNQNYTYIWIQRQRINFVYIICNITLNNFIKIPCRETKKKVIKMAKCNELNDIINMYSTEKSLI